VINGVDHAAAVALCEADPFYVAGALADYRIFAFGVPSLYDDKF